MHVQLFIHQNPQVLPCGIALNELFFQSAHISGISFNPTTQVIDKDAERHKSQVALWQTMLFTSLHLYMKSLAVIIQSILYPPSSPPFKSIYLPFGDKSVMLDLIRGLAEVQPLATTDTYLSAFSFKTQEL